MLPFDCYGYPPCCIRWFAERPTELTQVQIDAGLHHGFLPCPDHAAEFILLDPEERLLAIRKLLATRSFPLPFPFDTMDLVHACWTSIKAEDLPLDEPWARTVQIFGEILRGELEPQLVPEEYHDRLRQLLEVDLFLEPRFKHHRVWIRNQKNLIMFLGQGRKNWATDL